ncbi:galactose mutarotase [Sphaerisporangium corydalis]|uniref:Galactose mutarotase n=1 Tax=Sphaerisporangium corydalis TaxID=1441875 RepID=A0ABV9E9Z3_9ACTN|nr:galactose mutarotase [Sphaerisporangium corydalis]
MGTTRGHAGAGPAPVHAYTLDTGHGLAITVWTYGATLVEVLVPDRAGHAANVVVRLPDLAAYEDPAVNAYVGSTVGRYCRCVANGTFTLDGVVHELDRNDGRHHVHGGPLGFDRFVWDAEAETTGDRLVLRLRLDSPDGDQGYPGALTAEARYEVDRHGRLTFGYSATTTASTFAGLTNHAFWNLSGTGGTVDGHLLAVNSARVVGFDPELIPLPGPPRDVTGTALDRRTARPVGDDRLDHFYALGDPGWAADLTHEASGRAMRVVTDQPGMGVYSADHFRWPRAGICLETGAWPDAPNRQDFPSARLDPGQTYGHRTTHEFRTARPGRPGARGTGTDMTGSTPAVDTWEVGTDPRELHDLLVACDAYQAERTGTPVPARVIETTESRVRSGAVHLLRRGTEAVAMFTLTDRPPFDPAGLDLPEGGRLMYLSRLAVKPELLEQGSLVGVQCVRKAIELARGLGADALHAEANPDLTGTRALLAHLGFEQHGPVHSDGTGRRYVHLRKPLRPGPAPA